LKSSKRKKL